MLSSLIYVTSSAILDLINVFHTIVPEILYSLLHCNFNIENINFYNLLKILMTIRMLLHLYILHLYKIKQWMTALTHHVLFY